MNPLNDIREAAKRGDLSRLQQVFTEPGQLKWSKAQLDMLDELYDLAYLEDRENPLDWIIDFNRAIPNHFKVDGAKSRLEKVLIMAKVNHQQKAEGRDRIGFAGTKREI